MSIAKKIYANLKETSAKKNVRHTQINNKSATQIKKQTHTKKFKTMRAHVMSSYK